MRVLIAPDKFKGTLSAQQAAAAVAAGWRRANPSSVTEEVPMADGGEGTLDALVAALGGERFEERVTGPLGDPVRAEYGVAPGPEGPMAVIEMARASGLGLVPVARRDPRRASTRGTGELIAAAARRGSRSFLISIGGSATNDGGAGAVQALGVRLLDANGREIGPGGEALLQLARIDATGLDRAVAASRFVVATDVDNPLTGPIGASVVYGPQKGASPEDVALMDQALGHFAAVIYRDLGVDVRAMPGAGAAGGLGAGMVAFLGARLRPGVDVVMDAVRLPERLEGADVVVTGEGTFDAQSLHGKAPAGVLRAAAEAGVPAVVLCGRAEVNPPAPAILIASLEDRFGAEAALERAGPLLEELAFEAARRVEEELSAQKR
jgi:glycerate 2-kinase